MEFAKYYDATNKMNRLINDRKLFSYTKDYCQKLYICMDTHDFWISRILEGYNSEFEEEQGKWLIERNKIDKYDFCRFMKEKEDDDFNITSKHLRDIYIKNCFTTDEIIENVILMDDKNGLEGFDNYECDSLEEAIEIIDDGFGIIEL